MNISLLALLIATACYALGNNLVPSWHCQTSQTFHLKSLHARHVACSEATQLPIMSLPDFLSSSYKQYKEDTNCFTTWLHQTAKACGYSSHATQISGASTVSNQSEPANPSKRLKGKDRKLAKLAKNDSPKSSVEAVRSVFPKPVRYRSITHEIIQQAKLISESTKQSRGLPNGIKFVAQRAIAARQRFANHFAAVKGVDGASNAAHAHFNDTLQGALDLLTRKSSAVPSTISEYEAETRSLRCA